MKSVLDQSVRTLVPIHNQVQEFQPIISKSQLPWVIRTMHPDLTRLRRPHMPDKTIQTCQAEFRQLSNRIQLIP